MFITVNKAFFAENHYFLEGVVNSQERSLFLCYLFFVLHAECRLDVIASATLIANEINFKLGVLLFSLIVSNDDRYYSYINVEPSYEQFVIYDVFHDMRLFVLSEIYSSIA